MTLIDCDVHGVVPAVEALIPYLDEHWREVIATSQFSGPTDQPHPPNVETSLRADLEPLNGAAPGTNLDSLRAPHAVVAEIVEVGRAASMRPGD